MDATWLGDTLHNILNYALACTGEEGGDIDLPQLFAGLLAHGWFGAEGSFGHILYQNIAESITEIAGTELSGVSGFLAEAGIPTPPDQPASGESAGGWRATQGVIDLLEASRVLVRDLTGTGALEDRHLLAAFLTGRGDKGWLRRIFKEYKIDLAPVLERTVQVIHDGKDMDDLIQQLRQGLGLMEKVGAVDADVNGR